MVFFVVLKRFYVFLGRFSVAVTVNIHLVYSLLKSN